LKGISIVEQQGRVCGKLTRLLRKLGWKVSGPEKEEILAPDDVDDGIAPKVRIYSRGDGTTRIVLPDQISTDDLPDKFVDDHAFVRILKERAHALKDNTTSEIAKMLVNANVNNPGLLKSLEDANKAAKLLEEYTCVSITISRKDKQ
jgi:hypothetical protein